VGYLIGASVGFETAEFFSAEFYFKNNAAATVGEITEPMLPGDYSLLNRSEKRIYVEIRWQPGQIFFRRRLRDLHGVVLLVTPMK
jgi:hypothetical protein